MVSLLKFFCFLSLVAAFILIYRHLNDGFSIRQITPSIYLEKNEDSYLVNEQKREFLKKITSTPLKYLGKGCQFYVFESQTGDYVVKFFKQKHFRNHNWLKELPFFYKASFIDKQFTRKKANYEKLMRSCQIGFEKIPEQTGVDFIHLNKTTHLQMQLTLIDKLGQKHTIQADQIPFIIQRKAQPLEQFLRISSNEKIDLFIKKMHAHIYARCKKGIKDKDKALVQNMGLAQSGEVLLLDFGQLEEDSSLTLPEKTNEELAMRFGSLLSWSEKNLPSVSSILDSISKNQFIFNSSR